MCGYQWTPERRAARAVQVRLLKPWEKATGPKTAEGKARVSQNSYRGGPYRAAIAKARRAEALLAEDARAL